LDLDKKNQKTSLYDLHIAHGGRMVDFCGYVLPIQFQGIVAEHKHVRQNAGLFDVSHMGQISISGADFDTMAKALEALMPADILSLKKGEMRYSVLLNDNGGIEDDLIITRGAKGQSDKEIISIVVNAATKDNDLAILQKGLSGFDVRLEIGRSLIALQGPKAAEVIRRHSNVADELIFMQAKNTKIAGFDVFVSRSGYTGEDGFEICIDDADAPALAEILLNENEVEPIGLGARDSLRLEAGLCLYGHDMNANIDPISASIIFAIGKRRRNEGGFVGAKAVLEIIANGVKQKRVGMMFEGRMPVRAGAELIDENDDVIGYVTSGTSSPMLETPIAMGYLPKEQAKIGTGVCALVRNKKVYGSVVKMPFVKQNYVRALS